MEWISLSNGQLNFWSLKNSQPIQKKIDSPRVKKLILNREGQIAGILYPNGVIQLVRSYNFPTQMIQGYRNQPIQDLKVHQDLDLLLTLDQGGTLQRFKLGDDQKLSTITPPLSSQLVQADWTGMQGAVVAWYKTSTQHLIKIYQSNGRALDVYRGPAVIKKLHASEYSSSILIQSQTPEGERLLQVGSSMTGKLNRVVGTKPFSKSITHLDGYTHLLYDSNQRIAELIDSKNFRKIKTLRLTQPIQNAQFGLDGKSLLIHHQDEVRIWSLNGQNWLQSYQIPQGQLKGAILTEDRLYTAFHLPNQPKKDRLSEWDLHSKTLKTSLGVSQSVTSSIAWSPRRNLVAIGDEEGRIILHSLNSPDSRILRGHQGPLLDLQFSPDGLTLWSGSVDQSSVRWNLKNGKEQHRFIGLKKRWTSWNLHPQNTLVGAGDQSGQMIIWDRSGQIKAQWKADSTFIRSLQFAPQQPYLLTLSGRGQGKVWKLNSSLKPTLVFEFPNQIDGFKWISSSTSSWSIVVLNRSGEIQSWSQDLSQPTLLFKYPVNENTTQRILHAFSKTGSYLVCAQKNMSTMLYDLTGTQADTINHELGDITTLAVKESGHVFLGGVNGDLWTWNPQTTQTLRLGKQYGELAQMRTSAQSELFLSRSDRQVLLWQGPFEHTQLKTLLNQVSPLCMSSQKRMNLLNESNKEAQFAYEACLSRRKESQKTTKR